MRSHRLNKKNQRILEQAKKDGFLITPNGQPGVLDRAFVAWCEINKRPIFACIKGKKYSSISIDTILVRNESNRVLHLGPSQLREIGCIIAPHIQSKDWFSPGATFTHCRKIPTEHLTEIAKNISMAIDNFGPMRQELPSVSFFNLLPFKDRLLFYKNVRKLKAILIQSEEETVFNSGYIYIAPARHAHTVHAGRTVWKIGCTQDWQKRIYGLERHYRVTIDSAIVIKANRHQYVERVIHYLFAEHNCHGLGNEWFALTKSQIKWFRSISSLDGRTIKHHVSGLGINLSRCPSKLR